MKSKGLGGKGRLSSGRGNRIDSYGEMEVEWGKGWNKKIKWRARKKRGGAREGI